MSKREALIAACVALAFLGSVGFMVAYAVRANTQLEGLAVTGALVGFTLAALGWMRWIVGD